MLITDELFELTFITTYNWHSLLHSVFSYMEEQNQFMFYEAWAHITYYLLLILFYVLPIT